MSIIPTLPVLVSPKGIPEVLVDSLVDLLPRCDCCPSLCIPCEEETRNVPSFNDTSRRLGANGDVVEGPVTAGPWHPVACWDDDGPTPRLPFISQGPSPGALFDEGFLTDACPISRPNLPAGPFPLSTCRIYFWQDAGEVEGQGQIPIWISATEVFRGNPFDTKSPAVGWYVMEQFLIGTEIFPRAFGFTFDTNWPFTLSAITLLGCVAPAVMGLPLPNIREITLGRLA